MKMFIPGVQARIEQPHQRFRRGGVSRDVCTFCTVTTSAGPTCVLHRVGAMMLGCANVVDLVGQNGVLLIELAILAAPVCTLSDEITPCLGHRLLRATGFFQGLPSLSLDDRSEEHTSELQSPMY